MGGGGLELEFFLNMREKKLTSYLSQLWLLCMVGSVSFISVWIIKKLGEKSSD